MCSFDAVETMSLVAGQETSTTPCGIDVQPEAVLFAQVRNGMDGIESPDNSGSLRAVHEERSVTKFQALDYQSLQLCGNHATPAHVDWHSFCG